MRKKSQANTQRQRKSQGSVLGATALASATMLVLWLFAANLLAVWRCATSVMPFSNAKSALVLGAAQYNGQPSPLFRARLEQARRLYQRGAVERVVVTGGVGVGDVYAEGTVGRRYLIRHGLPQNRVLAETESRNTLENLRLALRFLPAGEEVALVTDGVHAMRALALAQAFGIEAEVAPAVVQWHSSGRFWRYVLREAATTTVLALWLRKY
jgi:uncharacterized SAM-binding protein YcdF (DUF218 family)